VKPVSKPDTKQTAKPARVERLGRIVVGVIVMTASLACIGVEAARNYAFGAKEAAGGLQAIIAGCSFTVFAVLLAVLPFLARQKGWNAALRALYLFSMAATAYCGVAYYVDDIRTKARAAQRATRVFDDARRDRERAEAERDQAQAEASGIAEKRSSAVLRELHQQAEARRQAEASAKRGGCGDRCRDAEKLAEQALAAMSQAEARERAETRAREAQQRADTARAVSERGPAEVSGMAGLAEDIVGINAFVYASWEGLAKPVAEVLGMLGAAALLDSALELVLIGFGLGAANNGGRAPHGLTIELPTKPALRLLALSAKSDAPKGGRKPLSQEDRIMQFVEERLRPGAGEVTPAEIRAALHSWWQVKCPAAPVPTDRAVSAVLTKRAGITKTRPGGYVHYAAALVW